MSSIAESFKLAIPRPVLDFVLSLNNRGIKVAFVGGVVRDFILYNRISKDIDIELRSNSALNMSALASELRASINEEFQIISLQIDDYCLELGKPRVEEFYETDKTHKNFKFQFIDSYDLAVKRRDLTINSIMIEFFDEEVKLIDLLGGVNDLSNKLINNCSEDFSRDPVRFLRAHRFRINLNFSFTKSLSDELSLMSYKDSSHHYLRQEASKCSLPLSFLSELGIIEDFDRSSLYNSSDFPLNTAIRRDFSVSNRELVLKSLGLSSKGLFVFKGASIKLEENIELYNYFVNEKLALNEIEYCLNTLKMDYSTYSLKTLFNRDLKVDCEHIPARDRASYVFKELLSRAKNV